MLAETGSKHAAAETATPWATTVGGGLGTFENLAAQDPVFKERWRQAVGAFAKVVEQEINRRALSPNVRPVYVDGVLAQVPHEHPLHLCTCSHGRARHTQRGRGPCREKVDGEPCGCAAYEPDEAGGYLTEEKQDNQLLVRVARKVNREEWSETAEVKHTGAVVTVAATIDFSKLSEEQLELIERLAGSSLAPKPEDN